MSCPRLETVRLALVPLQPEDADALFEMWDSESFSRAAGIDRPADRAAVAAVAAFFVQLNATGTYLKWSVRDRSSDEFLGECELYPLKPQVHPWIEWGIGYSLKESAWGRGYMTEALRRVLDHLFDAATPASRVKADVDPANGRSRALLERLGFRLEGTQSAKCMIQGRACEMLLMAQTRDGHRAVAG